MAAGQGSQATGVPFSVHPTDTSPHPTGEAGQGGAAVRGGQPEAEQPAAAGGVAGRQRAAAQVRGDLLQGKEGTLRWRGHRPPGQAWAPALLSLGPAPGRRRDQDTAAQAPPPFQGQGRLGQPWDLREASQAVCSWSSSPRGQCGLQPPSELLSLVPGGWAHAHTTPRGPVPPSPPSLFLGPSHRKL